MIFNKRFFWLKYPKMNKLIEKT